ncbi:MFS transporter [Luteibacter rhizovicinus]|uniref:MFS transporter n=1 Tax=Luteibacter rhizovicinus TaxID=242606 RepID=UPI00098FD8E0|nr:MFS transporter [Luteibacter rhizovicinus]
MARLSPPLVLRVLSMCNFALGSASLAIVGAQASMVSGGMTVAQAAELVAVFALTFSLGAPLAQVFVGHRRRRDVLIGGLLILALGSVLCAVAPSYGWLLAARVLAGLGATVVGPMASSIGAGIVPPERQGHALAVVFSGIAIASVLSVPLAISASAALGWRVVFVGLAVLAGAAALLVWLTVDDQSRGIRLDLRRLLKALTHPATGTGLAVIFFQVSAYFVTYTLITALLRDRFGADTATASGIMFGFGILGVAGNWLAQRLALRFGANRLLYAAMGTMLPVFLALAVVPAYWWAPVLPLLAWALAQDVFYPSQQRRVVELEPEIRGLVLALNSSGLFAGIALGSFLGGRVAQASGVATLPVISLLLTALALTALTISRLAARKHAHQLRSMRAA